MKIFPTDLLTENEPAFIPLSVIHQLENPGEILLQIVEVHSGSHLWE